MSLITLRKVTNYVTLYVTTSRPPQALKTNNHRSGMNVSDVNLNHLQNIAIEAAGLDLVKTAGLDRTEAQVAKYHQEIEEQLQGIADSIRRIQGAQPTTPAKTEELVIRQDP